MSTQQTQTTRRAVRGLDVTVLVALAVIAVRIVDDAFLRRPPGCLRLQPRERPGTGRALALAALGLRFVGRPLPGSIALTCGVVGIAAVPRCSPTSERARISPDDRHTRSCRSWRA